MIRVPIPLWAFLLESDDVRHLRAPICADLGRVLAHLKQGIDSREPEPDAMLVWM